MIKALAVIVLAAIVALTQAVSVPSISIERRWYVGGTFDSLKNTDGTAFQAKNFAYWDGANWGNMGTDASKGSDGPVYTIKMDAKFNLMVGGAFTKMEGVATGPVARYSTKDSKWEAINGAGTFNNGAQVRALATDCFSLTLATITTTRCDVYFGGKFTLTGAKSASGTTTATNVARWVQKDETTGYIENLGAHGITGTVWALYKKSLPTVTGSSSTYLWVGGNNLKATADSKWFGRFENVEEPAKVSYVGLDNGMNGPVTSFEYITKYLIGQTDDLFVAGNFTFTATGGASCRSVCKFNHKDKKFVAIDNIANNFNEGQIYDIGLNGNDLVVGGSFKKPFANLARLPSGKAWDLLAGSQTAKVNFVPVTIDVCSSFSKSCEAGSVAAGSKAGQIQYFDNTKAEWKNFGGALNPLNKTTGSPELATIYSYAAAGSVKVTFAVLAVAAFVATMLV